MNFKEEDNMEPNELPDNLNSIRYLNTYKTPPGYFDNLADEIISQISLPINSKIPFSSPSVNYFDGLADSILSKIKAGNSSSRNEVEKELEEIEPLLARIPKKNVYSVPDNYFDSFTVQVPAIQTLAPVRQLNRPARWITYVAAAVVTGIVATGVIFFANNNTGGVNSGVGYKINYEQVLAKVSDNEISDYLDKNTPPDTDFASTSQDGSTVTDSEGLFKTLLNNVSDNQIQDYLQENSDGDEKDIKGI